MAPGGAGDVAWAGDGEGGLDPRDAGDPPMSEEDHSQDLEDLTLELRRRKMAYDLLAQQLAQHVERETRLTAALNTASILIDQLLSDLRLAGGTPSANLLAAYDKFTVTMRKLFDAPSD
jgi:hypothetical protein